MKRSDYQAVVKDLADALKMNWAYGVEFVEVDPKILGTQSFANVENQAERKELEDLFSVDKTAFWACMAPQFSLVILFGMSSSCPFIPGLRLVQRREEVWESGSRETQGCKPPLRRRDRARGSPRRPH